jgi:uncharacterized protein YdaU (DUF1376 family)
LHARGLYRELLTQAWRRGASLPANIEDLQKICAVTPKEWRQAWPLVEPFWRLDGDRLVNDTQLEVYAEAERRSAFFKSRASRAARARWNGASSNA